MTTPDDENHKNNEKPALEKERVFELNASLERKEIKKGKEKIGKTGRNRSKLVKGKKH